MAPSENEFDTPDVIPLERTLRSLCWALTNVAQLGGHHLKGYWFHSRLGHMPGLWIWSQVRSNMRGN